MSNDVVSHNRTISVHKEHEFLLKLEGAGLSDIDAQKVIQSKNNALAQQIVMLIREYPIGSIIDWAGYKQFITSRLPSAEKALKEFLAARPDWEGSVHLGECPPHLSFCFQLKSRKQFKFKEGMMDPSRRFVCSLAEEYGMSATRADSGDRIMYALARSDFQSFIK